MVKLVKVDPDSIDNARDGRRGRVAYPILKQFLESGDVLVRVDREDMRRSLMSLSTGLSSYVKAHGLPVKVFQRQGELYLIRTDLNNDGTVKEVKSAPEQAPQPAKTIQEVVEAE